MGGGDGYRHAMETYSKEQTANGVLEKRYWKWSLCVLPIPLYTTFTILPSDHLFHPTKHHPIHPIILEKNGTAADINRPHLTHKSILPVFFTHFPNNSSTRSLFFFRTFTDFTSSDYLFSKTHSLCYNTHCLISTLFYTHHRIFLSLTFSSFNVLFYSIHFFRFRNHLRPPFWTAALPLRGRHHQDYLHGGQGDEQWSLQDVLCQLRRRTTSYRVPVDDNV